MNLCPMDRGGARGSRSGSARKATQGGNGKDRGKGPTNVSSGNLVLTEKGDLDEDKYSSQVKTSKSLDKESKEL